MTFDEYRSVVLADVKKRDKEIAADEKYLSALDNEGCIKAQYESDREAGQMLLGMKENPLAFSECIRLLYPDLPMTYSEYTDSLKSQKTLTGEFKKLR